MAFSSLLSGIPTSLNLLWNSRLHLYKCPHPRRLYHIQSTVSVSFSFIQLSFPSLLRFKNLICIFTSSDLQDFCFFSTMIIHYASIIASALLCFSAVPGVLARPLDDSNSVARRATKPKPWDMSNKTLVCGAKFSDTDKKVNEDIWYQSGSGIYLDVFIKPETYHGWVKNFDMMTWNKANSDWDCTATSSVCGVPGDCGRIRPQSGPLSSNKFLSY